MKAKKLLLLLPAALALSSCSLMDTIKGWFNPEEQQGYNNIEKIKNLNVPQSITVGSTLSPSDVTFTVVYKDGSEAQSFADKVELDTSTVGLVTGTAYYANAKFTFQINVTEKSSTVPVTSITLNKKTLFLEELDTEQLTYTLLPDNASNKVVTWESSNGTVASVENGLVTGLNAGTAVITVYADDGAKLDTCNVTVSKRQDGKTAVNKTLNFGELGYTKDQNPITEPFVLENDFTFTFEANGGTTPSVIKYNNVYAARAYAKNTVKITSKTAELSKISFTFDAKKDGTNEITASVGSYADGVWNGNAKEVTFTIGGTSGCRAFDAITLTYLGQSEDDPETVINLGEKTISEVKQYIADHPVAKNSFGNGVNEKRYVTIKGEAVARIDTVKEKASFGLDCTYPAKVIIADETDYIGVATKIGEGTLWNKVDKYACGENSKYSVTGYISEIQGNPELKILSFQWDKTMEVNWSASALSKSTETLEGFYSKATNVKYNCAGHGYGDVITVKNLKCLNMESDGQGVRYYNFTDGTKNLRVNAYNISGATVGNVYDVTGIISLRDLSPIIIAFEIKTSAQSVSFDYATASQEITVENLRKIHGSQDDTNTRYPEVINAFGTFYKTTGYLVSVEEGGKVYYGLCDKFQANPITGKNNAKANYGVALIKNDNFWNTSYDESARYNPYNDEYFCEDKPVTVYYTVRQLGYQSGKTMWEILLIPESIPAMPTL